MLLLDVELVELKQNGCCYKGPKVYWDVFNPLNHLIESCLHHLVHVTQKRLFRNRVSWVKLHLLYTWLLLFWDYIMVNRTRKVLPVLARDADIHSAFRLFIKVVWIAVELRLWVSIPPLIISFEARRTLT